MNEKEKLPGILNFDKLVEKITKFFELKLEIYELKVKEQIVIVISSLATIALIISFGLFMIFFGSLAFGFYLNGILDSRYLGFVIVGFLYLVICMILILFKDKIITNRLFQAIFSDSLTIDDDEQKDRE
ncbi:MAG: hypothetical protein MI975_11295 [Cytophagales bacterium]|nr:hypothetical protein [Cytophagales bacterium]